MPEISKETANKYARELISKMADKDGHISFEKLQSPPTMWTVDPEKLIFFSKVSGFLKDFAHKDEQFLRSNPDVLTVKNINMVASRMIDFADEHGTGNEKNNGKVSLGEADVAIASFDPKTALPKTSGRPQTIAQR
jgi:hypothetical protein